MFTSLIQKIGFFQFLSLFLVFFVTVFIFIQRIVKDILSVYVSKVKDFYSELVFTTWFGASLTEIRKIRIPFFHRSIVKQIIIENISVLAGEDRNYLLNIYTHLNFHIEDGKDMLSQNWGQRFAALNRLSYVLPKDLDVFLIRILPDQKPFISLTAMHIIAKNYDPNLIKLTEQDLKDCCILFPDIFSEILLSIGEKKPTLVVDLWRDSHSIDVKKVLLNVFGELRSLDAVDVVIRTVASHHEDDSVRACAFEALRKMMLPGGEAAAVEALHHTTPAIRLSALRYLMEISYTLPEESLGVLMEDTDPAIVQLTERWIVGGV